MCQRLRPELITGINGLMHERSVIQLVCLDENLWWSPRKSLLSWRKIAAFYQWQSISRVFVTFVTASLTPTASKVRCRPCVQESKARTYACSIHVVLFYNYVQFDVRGEKWTASDFSNRHIVVVTLFSSNGVFSWNDLLSSTERVVSFRICSSRRLFVLHSLEHVL